MKNTKATTFRLSDEVSNELEVLRQKLGYPTMNQTIEYVVLNYRKTASELIETKERLNSADLEAWTQKERVTRFVSSLKELMEP